jgi:hypothetical protein
MAILLGGVKKEKSVLIFEADLKRVLLTLIKVQNLGRSFSTRALVRFSTLGLSVVQIR